MHKTKDISPAQHILTNIFGYDGFRGSQLPIINALAQQQNVLAIMPTGSGKSLCYQIPALMLDGVAIIISPLIALMQDQVSALQLLSIQAACVHANSSNEEIKDIAQKLQTNSLKLLYISPERMVSAHFLSFISTIKISLFAIDEAHCVSQWGHNFRPEYRQLAILSQNFSAVPRIALTATADSQTQNDIKHYLSLDNANIFIDSFLRENINYQVIEKKEGKKQLVHFLHSLPKNDSGIVYCFSRKRVDELSLYLQNEGFNALPYHAGLDYSIRQANQQRFTHEEGIIIVATVAFGMGINKPDVRFVAHLDMPKSIEHFYQESGRAGRDGLAAVSWLCYGLNDWVLLNERIRNGEGDDTQKQIELQKLGSMLNFCEITKCRRQFLLEYFQEKSIPCKQCDNCINTPLKFDATIHVQKLLSCVYRVGQQFSITHIIDILKGKQQAEIISNNHQTLSTFGIGSDLSVSEWRSIIRQSLISGLLQMNFYNQSLQLTPSSRDVLMGHQQIFFKYRQKSKAKAKSIAPTWLRTERQERLWQELKAWRYAYAQEQGLPTFVIFNDRTLQELVIDIPTNSDDLYKIYGLAQAKISKFGPEIINICHKHT